VPLVGNRRVVPILLLVLSFMLVSLPQVDATEWVEVARFTDSGTTNNFICEHIEWRIRWEYAPYSSFPESAVFSVGTYEAREGEMLIDQVFKTGDEETSGVSYIHDREGVFYMNISATNIEGFTVIVELSVLPTIYIRADGSVEGTDKIQRDGDVYTLTGDIAGGITVQRNFTVIDGAGYTLQGNGYGTGVNIRWCGTVQNLQIRNFAYGISAVYDNTIIRNYIANCDAGIWIIGGSNNTIKNNTLVNNTNPISISYSSRGGHVITENSIINGTTIIVWMAPQPTVDRNYWSDYNGTDSDGDGIGDTPHIRIVGDETVYIDYHPLMEPVPVIPEFPSWIILPLFLTASLVAIFYSKRVRARLRHF
jgi:parallel beta-helix repeat protein